MSLVPHKIVALEGLFTDAQISGKLTVESAIVIMYNSDAAAVTLYDDENFTNGSTAS